MTPPKKAPKNEVHYDLTQPEVKGIWDSGHASGVKETTDKVYKRLADAGYPEHIVTILKMSDKEFAKFIGAKDA